MRFDNILNTIASAAHQLSAFGVPGAGLAESAIKGAEGLAAAFDHFKAANGGAAPPEAQAIRDTKLEAVLKHAQTLADRLDPAGAGKGG